MEKEFSRVRSAKDITIAATLVIAGCALVALHTSASINITGFFMIFTGLILAFVLRTGYKDNETGEKYSKMEKFFAQNLKNEISNSLETSVKTQNLSEEDKGNGIRLDIYYSKKTGKSYSQLFEYIPYKYEPCTRQFEHETAEIESIIGK
jgi:hypothetical protein